MLLTKVVTDKQKDGNNFCSQIFLNMLVGITL